MNNNLDERQEQKLLQIERNGCWFTFWGFLIAILVQIVLGCAWRSIIGECIVFTALSLYMCIACMRNGIWDRRLKPNFNTHLMISIISSLILGVLWFGISYHNHHKLVGSIATGVFMFIYTGVLFLLVLSFSTYIHKKRVEKLEMDEDEE